MTLLVLALLTLLPQTTVVEGVVTKPGGGEPLGGARVTLTSADPDAKRQFSSASEDDGRFTFSNIPPGDYTLTAESSRYGVVTLGQRRPGGPASTLSVVDGQRLTEIKVTMTPTGAIAGRITGRNGEPAVKASVQAYQSVYRDGKKMFASVQSATANDLGEYRLFWLPPGKYLVAATPGESGVSELRTTLNQPPNAPVFQLVFRTPVVRRLLDDGSVQEETWMPVYYPGTTEPRDATPVDVAAGATMSGVHIAITPSPVRKVSGQVIAPAGTSARARLVPLTDYNGLEVLPVSISGTSFEFKGVKPGSYVLLAEDGRNYASAPIPIEVGDRDVENLRIGIRPKTTVTGRVTLENSAGEKIGLNAVSPFVIVLHQGSVEFPMNTFQPDPNTGSFVLNDVIPGEYQIQIRPLVTTYIQLGTEPGSSAQDSATLYLKSAKVGQTDVSNGMSITEGTPERMEIVVTRGSGSLEGVVVEPGRGGAAGSTVVLVPAVARKNSSLYRSTVADGSGRFRFQGVAAGDYLVLAWSDVETGAWQDPEFMRLFESRGLRVQVSASGSQDIQISVISTP